MFSECVVTGHKSSIIFNVAIVAFPHGLMNCVCFCLVSMFPWRETSAQLLQKRCSSSAVWASIFLNACFNRQARAIHITWRTESLSMLWTARIGLTLVLSIMAHPTKCLTYYFDSLCLSKLKRDTAGAFIHMYTETKHYNRLLGAGLLALTPYSELNVVVLTCRHLDYYSKHSWIYQRSVVCLVLLLLYTTSRIIYISLQARAGSSRSLGECSAVEGQYAIYHTVWLY